MFQQVLEGRSIIDWPRAFFTTEEEVLGFLRVNEFDLSKPRDTERLTNIHREAITYLEGQLNLQFDPAILKPEKLTQLFLFSSQAKSSSLQKLACSVLKTMNIITHINGRELLYNCPISQKDLFSLVEDKVERALSSLSRRESGLLKYQGGRKPKDSLMTKLLCKRETIAAQIYDRVRYRIVTKTREDILKVVLYLFDSILPFNFVIPEVSVNQLIPLNFRERLTMTTRALQRRIPRRLSAMEYSGKNYRVCKFVVDIPIRMDNFLAASNGPSYRESLGTIAYVLVEFQIVDQETELFNNAGESSHENYKNRQKSGVLRRLTGRARG